MFFPWLKVSLKFFFNGVQQFQISQPELAELEGKKIQTVTKNRKIARQHALS